MFTITINKYHFAPCLKSSVVALMSLVLLISLGCWQIQRAAEKRLILEKYVARQQQVPQSLTTLLTLKDKNFMPVIMTGQFDNAHQLLLDNQFYNHQIGYVVFTPFYLQHHHQRILIKRGWIPANRRRAVLPEIKPIYHTLTLAGLVRVPSQKGFVLGNMIESSETWPKRIQKIDLAALDKLFNQDFYPFYVELTKPQQAQFVQTKQYVNMPPERHIAYAIQWFLLGLVLLVVYIAVNISTS